MTNAYKELLNIETNGIDNTYGENFNLKNETEAYSYNNSSTILENFAKGTAKVYE
jgi:hypothetical protein